MRSTVSDLRSRDSWDPTDLLERPRILIPSETVDSVPLTELAAKLAPQYIEPDTPLVGSRSIDPVTGAITSVRPSKSLRAFKRSMVKEGGLREGDVLVPSNPRLPAVLVRGTQMEALAFHLSFVALRAETVDPILLWAVLSSRSGVTARQQAAGRQPSQMWDRFPWELIEVDRNLSEAIGKVRDLSLLLPEPPVRFGIEAPAVSTWRLVSLAEFKTWEHAVRDISTPEQQEGVPVADLGEVFRGRTTRHSEVETARLPLWDVKAVTAGTPTESARASSPHSLVEEGDILITTVGSPHVAVASSSGAAGSSVAVIRLQDSSLAPGIVNYLAGESGSRRLRKRMFGAVPHLSFDELRDFRIPYDVLEHHRGRETSRIALADRLEALLWS